ncbi:fumarylacetoacetate hydrolase family protein [uncultured Cocleimonas sp.]|uniref:fumarylacetoacetate hydrolase family protein n=1 Tax=uncultured Cocleimonas sp. TaxID=1051587 RepID=UPI00260605A3|nr:fumarylacetoacetate hydrolase family protein [uncultured Cocleimonas sp.]
MSKWARIDYQGKPTIAEVKGDTLHLHDGDLFSDHQENGLTVAIAEANFLAPSDPKQFLGLWNNFHERRVLDKLFMPKSPLIFVKLASCITGHKSEISLPKGYDQRVKFEAELGVVIGKECFQVSTEDVDDYIFGYTCVNDVTAPETLFEEEGFTHWCRSKSFPTFGPLGPFIETDIDPSKLNIQAILDGKLEQNYPVSDMIFSPQEIVSIISQDIKLLPGDVIACGTSSGAIDMQIGQTIEINIDGIGRLENTYVG